MATIARRRSVRVQEPQDNRNVQVRYEYVLLSSVRPYRLNPRDNTKTVPGLMQSIKSYGFLVPIVIDDNNELVTGHTRVEAANRLGMTQVPAIRASHLTPEQIEEFRIIDNKLAELSEWSYELLAPQISRMRERGLDLTQFGYTQEEVDCLSQMVADDCLDPGGLVDATSAERLRTAERRTPTTARFVCGEIVFFVTIEAYREWVDRVRAEHDFDEDAIVAFIKERLGIRG